MILFVNFLKLRSHAGLYLKVTVLGQIIIYDNLAKFWQVLANVRTVVVWIYNSIIINNKSDQ